MTVVPRSELGAATWDAFVEAHPRGWWWHTSEWIDYCLAYQPDAEDLSFALCGADGGPEAVVPMVREDAQVAMGGNPCACALAWRTVPPEAVVEAVDAVARRHGVSRVRMRGMPVPPSEVPRPVPPYWRDCSWQSYVLDLTPPTGELWRGVRRSYHQLVRRAERDRMVLVTAKPWAVDFCQKIHRRAAGRDTRPPATWQKMRRWADEGHALVALVSSAAVPSQEWSGFAYVIRWKNWAYYASGATLEQSTAHVLQWQLVEALRCGGVTRYELGWAERPGDTEKDRGIAHFKAGWGGALWTVPACERRY